MSKAITLAIFMVILVLGMVTKETQAKKCYEYIVTPEENCESLVCAHDCTMRYNGIGVCYDTTSKTCICAYNC
ncbi:hypothetical protein CARUB_v10018873mg [Capsella rubella]|uniref:Knottin scorpion toxin-like domain-containing protein n=1 Tax=Capsella rubella TaxID=81985 RepID=R0H893_9BRAS|nr:defensin-like protein 125 [Capsella rubella]EOA25529.1 hypothetical protein CARUB_v10018873mg [Capsella rubella]